MTGQTEQMPNLTALIESALSLRGTGKTLGAGDPPARFSVLLSNEPVPAVTARLRGLLQNESIDLASVAGDEAVLTFTTRTFPLERALQSAPAAYELGHALARSLGLRVVQPDLPRPASPSRMDRGAGAEGLESVDNFPPGCWVGEEPALNSRPHWALEAVRLPEAWKFSTDLGRPSKGYGIVVAQPDTGISHHPRLSGIVLAGGFNTLGDRLANDPTDPLEEGFALNPGHGTATGSVVLSREEGGEHTVIGSAPLARHIPIRAVRSVWLHEEIPIARAIDTAVDAGAHIISMSLGGSAMPFSPLRAAIQRAVARHVIVMAAAGNCVDIVVYPARFSECLAVAGTNAADVKWPGSCFGPSVAIAAPGQNVFRASVKPEPEGSVGQGQGTSFAVALTAGVAACWLAHHGRDKLVREAVARQETLQNMFRRLLRATARVPDGWDGVNMGAGIVDARGALARSHPLVATDGGRPRCVLVGAADSGSHRDIVFTRADVGEIQLAKGAIRAGTELLLEAAGVAVSDLDEVVVAGAFGTYLDVRSAIRVGLLPALLPGRFRQVGNAAGAGARRLLLSSAARRAAAELPGRVQYLELTTHAEFGDHFAEAVTFT